MLQDGYEIGTEVIADRIRWAMAMLSSHVQRARREGWLEGDTVELMIDPDELGRAICERTDRTRLDPLLQPMRWLAIRLNLDDVQVEALWLLAAIELSPAVTRLAEELGAASLTVQTLLQLIPLTQSDLVRLSRLALVEFQPDPSIPRSRRPIRASDRLLTLLQGELELDLELREVVTLVGPTKSDPRVAFNVDRTPFVVAVGPEGSGRTTTLAASVPGRGTLRVRSRALARDEASLRRQLKLIVREACLFDVVPLFQELEIDLRIFEEELAHFNGPLLATSSSILNLRERPVVVHELSKPDAEESQGCWARCLGVGESSVLASAAQTYRLWPGAIHSASRNALAMQTGVVDAAAIQAGVRAHLGDSLRGLATKVDWKQTWNDLVLPNDQLGQIIELVARVRHRSQVLEEWGFGAKTGKGNGITALLSGAPGTGKTMVAGLIARELELDLYQVDLSKIVSKFIGETEKQLGKLFDAAETGQVIILFDEADSLFAKRSEVKSSNDRYANLEVNYLLQRIEAFTGVALLTTNHERSIDEAFRRRLSAHIKFPVPDEAQREQLWRAMLPAIASTADDLDFARLASEFDLSGGYIKNAVLRAAYLAAYEQSPIAMRHMWSAARMECESLGRIVR